MASKSTISVLKRKFGHAHVSFRGAIVAASLALIGCTAAPPPESRPLPKPELSEQNVVLVSLVPADIQQILFDELSRIARIASIAAQSAPAGDVKEGCLTYLSRPADKLTVIDFACTGREPRRDVVSMDREVKGSGIVRTADLVTNYSATLDVRRYRPTAPGKTVRNATIDQTMTIAGFGGGEDTTGDSGRKSFEARSRFIGHRSTQLPRRESWATDMVGELVSLPGSSAVIAPTSKLELSYSAEDGSTTTISATPREAITFANGELSRCLRPIGRFTMKITAAGVTKEIVVESSASGFADADSTSVVPWPPSCLENVDTRVEEN